MSTSSILSCVVQFQSGAPRHCSHGDQIEKVQKVLVHPTGDKAFCNRWGFWIGDLRNNKRKQPHPAQRSWTSLRFTRASISSFYFGITIASCSRSFRHWTPKWQRFGTGFKVHWVTHYFEFHAYRDCNLQFIWRATVEQELWREVSTNRRPCKNET